MGKKRIRKENLWDDLTSSWKSIAAGCSLLGMGFTAGAYIEHLLSKAEALKRESEYQEERIMIKSKHLQDLEILRNKNYELQNKLLDNERRK